MEFGKTLRKVKKLRNWQIILYSVLICFVLFALIRTAVYQISHPNSVYEDGSFQCWQFELSNEPCPFIEFLFSEIIGIIVLAIILLFPPFVSPLLGLVVGVLIIISLKKVKHPFLKKIVIVITLKIFLYLLILYSIFLLLSTIWPEHLVRYLIF